MSLHRRFALVLAVQLVLVVVAWWPSGSSGARGPAIDVDRDAIERIEIALRPVGEAEPEPAVLVKGDDGWTVASAANYPATESKVEEMLDKLLGLHTGMPITTSPTSHDALKVGDETYGRRIVIATADDSHEWLVGAATSRSVNLRRVGEDEVYRASGSGEWSFRDSSSSYFDTTYVDADPAAFSAVSVRNDAGELSFEKVDGVWRLTDTGEDEQSDAAKIESFLQSVARLRMSEPVGTEVTPEHGLDDGPRIDWTVASEDQSEFGGYAVGAEVEGDRFVKAVGRPFVVRARRSDLRRLLEASRSEFLLGEG